MSKYLKLKSYLERLAGNRVVLTFEEIESILESKLPDSARIYREWWGNDAHHTQARNGWLAAGWKVISVDFSSETVEFSKIGSPGHGLDDVEGIRNDSSKTSWKEFESIARGVMSKYFGVELKERRIPGHPKTFDLVSEDGRIVGDAKFLTMVRGERIPPAKFMEISGHVWMLEKVDAERKFLVFGNDIRVPKEWLKRFGRFVEGVEFFFIDVKTKDVIKLL